MTIRDAQCHFKTSEGEIRHFPVQAVVWHKPEKNVDVDNIVDEIKERNSKFAIIMREPIEFSFTSVMTKEREMSFRCTFLKWVRLSNGKYIVPNNCMRRHKRPMRRRAYEQMQKLRSRDHLDQDERYRKSNAV